MTVVLQCAMRMWLARKCMDEAKAAREIEMMVVLQRAIRMWLARKRMDEAKAACDIEMTVVLQCAMRMWLARKCMDEAKTAREIEMTVVLQCAMRMWLARKRMDAERVAPEGLYKRLVRARPDLLEEGLFKRAGISASVISMLGKGNDRATLQKKVFMHLDQHAFDLVKISVEKVEKGVTQIGASYHARRFPLHVSLLKNPDNHLPFSDDMDPWLDIAYAVLGSPRVQFNSSQKSLAYFAGLQLVIDTWQKAQTYRNQIKALKAITNKKHAAATRVQRWFHRISSNRLKPIVLSDDYQAIETGEKCICVA